MNIQKVSLRGFKNFINLELQLIPGKNLLHGENGCGKTSILEALHILAFGRSLFRFRKRELINHDSTHFEIHSVTEKALIPYEIDAYFKKTFVLKLNQKVINFDGVSEIFYPLYFSSYDYNYFIESRLHIRKLFNRFIFGVTPLYIHYILRYNKVLKQKNHLLRFQWNGNQANELDGWNWEIAEVGNWLYSKRMEFVEELNKTISSIFSNEIEIRFLPNLIQKKNISTNTIFEDLQKTKKMETRRRYSIVGPHRDNYEIFHKNTNLKYLSAGEKKKYLLMSYIGYIHLFKNKRQDFPIFLIDDFDIAMDQKNLTFLIDCFPNMQIVATSVFDHKDFVKSICLSKEMIS